MRRPSASGEADIGIVPVIEMARQKLAYFRETGIASYGPVRSILLISKVPFREIRKLATDSGSRTSVMLSRIILAEKYGVEPQVISHPPDLPAMLGLADAALLIGDAACASIRRRSRLKRWTWASSGPRSPTSPWFSPSGRAAKR
jgi:predicted solute-binding protein